MSMIISCIFPSYVGDPRSARHILPPVLNMGQTEGAYENTHKHMDAQLNARTLHTKPFFHDQHYMDARLSI